MPKRLHNDGKTWAVLCHLSALLVFVGGPSSMLINFPLANIVGPLAIWLLKRKEHPLVEEQGKESINFQISMTIYCIIAKILVFFYIGALFLVLLVIADIIFIIIAAIMVSNDEPFQYPLTIRFIK